MAGEQICCRHNIQRDMPHSESPAMASPIVVDKSGSAPAPSFEDIQAFLSSIVTAKTSHASVDAAYALSEVLQNSVGFRGLAGYGVLDSLKKSAANKKDAVQREGAMNGIGALFERFPRAQKLSEVVFLVQDDTLLPLTIDALSDKAAPVRESAKYALDSLFDNLSAEAKVFGLLPALMKYLGKKSGKWQGAVGALEMIGRMADKAKMGMESLEVEQEKDILREAMGKKLEGLIPIVESFMHDLKSEVRFPEEQSLRTHAHTDCLAGRKAGCQVDEQSHHPPPER